MISDELKEALETSQRDGERVWEHVETQTVLQVAAGAPPAWHAEAQHKHQQWQQQADNMNTSSNQVSLG